ncbi:gliding motility-associated C-terminal domain-containing protein [Flagellimonas onchidii]|uniref:T9SS type B sorting domain-containing protein n=1 Tax=Flagellimonas onchidii TaxID=2562684 RepID=UPI0010A5BC1D|nr:gliding motility-associated C-terminal domain-containing protein [Allomuricauda onchidii]
MIYSIFKKKQFVLTTFLLLIIGTSAFAQTANTEDYDGDGILNNADSDDDNDGILDINEYDCTASDLIWGVPVWTGTGDPGDEAEINVTTTINATEVTVTNTGTDFVGNPGLDVTEGTGFNGTDGLLINALADELIGTSIVYTISFDRPVTGLSFSVVDIDLNTDPTNDFIDQVTVTASNESQNIALVNGTDYTVPNPAFVSDLGGGVFQGLQLVPFSNTTDGDVIFNIGQPVDQIVIEFTNADATSFSEFTAILISDLSWSCAYRDNDNDTLADHFDSDSDADTCPDALEGDGGFTLGDLDAQDSLGDTVDLNGIPTIAGAGQADVSSINASVTSNECDDDGDGVINITDGANSLDPCLPVQAAGYTGYDAANAIWAAGDCDGDTILNGDEVTNATDPYNTDTDGDGVADNLEALAAEALDPCLPVQAAGYTGYDSANAIWAAADCDGDGLINSIEVTNGTDPYLLVDTDGDGIDDDNETNDGTDLNDPCDPAQSAGYTGYDSANAIWAAADCDSDGVVNGDEATNGTDPYQASGDTDGDGIDDNNEVNNGTDLNDPCDPVQSAGYTGYDSANAIWAAADCDGDGVVNGDEDTNGTDPYQASGDTDGDGIDDDNETNDGTDLNDPCDPVQGAGYTGYDSANAIWAAADCDGDGVVNGDEDTNGTDPYEPSSDTDGDGIDDDLEANNGTDPNDPCDPVQSVGYTGYDSANAIWAAADCDGDGLTNSEELTLGTEVYNADTDGDTINDGQEVSDGTNPFEDCDSVGGTPLPDSFCDRDNDGLSDEDETNLGTDPDNPDSDGDTIQDGEEVSDNTDPLDPCDSDGGTPPQGTICGVEIGNSIITPDGDGTNDFFRIDNIELFSNNSVEIINRWGTPVFKTENYDNNSNAFRGIANTGTSLNKGNVLPAGVYFYIIKYVDEGERRNATGYLYINQ